MSTTAPTARPVTRTNGQAVASLICGLVGLVAWPILLPQILAIGFGHGALDQLRHGDGHDGGTALAVLGLVLGYLALAGAIAFYVAAVLGGSSANS